MKKNIFVLLFFMISCGGKTTTEITSVEDGIFINMGAEPRTMDPTLNSQSAVSTYIFHAFEGLTRKDQNNRVAPGVAESWDISDDGITYTFYLRKDAKWSDGKPVTADDFVFSWKRAVDPKTAAEYSSLMEPIKNAKSITAGDMPLDALGVNAIDDYTFSVILENPTAYFLEFIAVTGTYMPVREDIVNNNITWTENPETYICNGPYKMVTRRVDEEIVFELNEYYWNIDEQIAKKIIFVLMDDANAVLAGIKTGTLHFSSVTPPSAEIDKLISEGFIVPNQVLGNVYIEMNITNKAFEDPRIRRALSLAIDRDYIVENITKGGQIPSGAFVPPKIPDVQGEFRGNGGNYINVSSNAYQENILEAKRLMTEAWNGNGYPVIELRVTSGLYTLVAEAIQQMWKENLNINVVIIQEEFGITLERLIQKDYQMARMGWTGDYNDPMTMLDVMLSHNSINHTGFSNSEYDGLINFAKSSPDAIARMEALHKAETILLESMPIIPLFYRTDSLMLNPKLKGVILDPLARHKFNYAYLED